MKTELPEVGERAERCGNCRWWDRDTPDFDSGRCHRYPPNASLFSSITRAINARDAFRARQQDGGNKYQYDYEYVQPYTAIMGKDFDDGDGSIKHVEDSYEWPETYEDDFCGEWAAIPASLQGNSSRPDPRKGGEGSKRKG